MSKVSCKVAKQVITRILLKFCKVHSLPYAMKAKVEQELQKLEAQGIISLIKYSK